MVVDGPARILVVDDEAAICVTLDAVLRRQGYAVTTAADGEEALAYLMRRSFDLLLIDLRLPGMDGLELARAAQVCQPATTILFLTGSSDFRGRPVEEQVGYFPYLLKTASPQEVLARVAGILAPQP